jgi:hypothetical protein
MIGGREGVVTQEMREDVLRRAAHLQDLADRIRATRDSSTVLDLARDMRKTARELRELTRRRHPPKTYRKA